MGWIYIHTNKSNGKKYVGQTTKSRADYRWNNGEGYKGQLFYRAIQKYGWDNFEHEVRRCPDCLLDVMERNLIEYYHTTDSDFGYNLDNGGHKNKHHSEETKKKISEAKKGKYNGEKHPLYGKHRSEETKKKISESKKGKNTGENNPNYGRTGEKHPMYGKHHIEETKNRMSKSHEKFHYVIQSPSGEIFETSSLRAFCKEHDIHAQAMCQYGHTKGWTLVSKEPLC